MQVNMGLHLRSIFWLMAITQLCWSSANASILPSSQWYVNPVYTAQVEQALRTATDPVMIQNLNLMKTQPTFFWLDTIHAVQSSLGPLLINASKTSPPKLLQLVIY